MNKSQLDEIKTWPLDRVKAQYELELAEHRAILNSGTEDAGPLGDSIRRPKRTRATTQIHNMPHLFSPLFS